MNYMWPAARDFSSAPLSQGHRPNRLPSYVVSTTLCKIHAKDKHSPLGITFLYIIASPSLTRLFSKVLIKNKIITIKPKRPCAWKRGTVEGKGTAEKSHV